MPGTPCIYYGTELAMEGSYDPDCRRCFDRDESNWDKQFLNKVKELIALKKNPILQMGDVSITADDGAIKIVRNYNGKVATLTISSPTVYTITLDNK
ncbi:MAG: hypothetical protein IJJ59_11650 [Pseudobutyrivibrio sp.]|uniref:hypothetical protein n=1 Tax=Pseudobutyrivibrio sp. TaxID=2014367 RepID=UPI0025DAB0A7|nr:hypothetical protein [Pseudobutyrivibrio sp.]MBQ6463966.1 hypothetical protein [Pseudobutyrivibrio sp.]